MIVRLSIEQKIEAEASNTTWRVFDLLEARWIIYSSDQLKTIINVEVSQVIYELVLPCKRLGVQESEMVYLEVFSQLTMLHMLNLIVLQYIAVPQNDKGFILEVSRAIAQNSRYEIFLVLNK